MNGSPPWENHWHAAGDPVLLAAVILRDEDAMIAVFDRYWAIVYHSIKCKIKDEEQCETKAEQVFLEFWKDPGEMRPNCDVLRVRLTLKMLGVLAR